MAYRPWNLFLRFILEVAALMVFGYWGWLNWGWVTAMAAPIAIAATWGVFAVPGDPSRSGRAVVPIPGWLRLILELAVLYGATVMLGSVGQGPMALVLGAGVTIHYGLSYDRVGWLVRR